MSKDLNDEPIDPQLKALLAELRPTPPRDAGKVTQGKAKFLAEADAVFLGSHTGINASQHAPSWLEKIALFRLSFGQRALLASVSLAAAILVLLFGSAGMTGLAARSALPGDALYPVKTSLEDTRLNLTSSAARQVELQLSYAQHRLDELELLIAQGRYSDVEMATQGFDLHIQNALSSLENLALANPSSAVQHAAKISADLTRYAQALSGLTENVPDAVRGELERSIQTSETGGMVIVSPDGEIEFVGFIEQISPNVLVVNGQIVRLTSQTELKTRLQVGLLVKIHARHDSSGGLVAHEIEWLQAVPGVKNANLNGSSDDHQKTDDARESNTNEAANSNDAEQDHPNSNTNEGETGSNSNDAGAGNVNSNGSDHDENDNANVNDNQNDNENRNDNDNHNDNDHHDDNQNTNVNDHDENKNHNG